MIKMVIFDLDGVLVDAKDIHYHSLNQALPEKYRIDYQTHLNEFDGKKTKEKLEILSKKYDLPANLHEEVYEKKQKYTIELFKNLEPNEKHVELFRKLKEDGFLISVCSNSIRQTLDVALDKTDLLRFCDLTLSNEDVFSSKPHPEIYWKAMIRYGLNPEEVLIVEDSPVGLISAKRSSAHTIRVSNINEVNMKTIYDWLSDGTRASNTALKEWTSIDTNVLIPMAGAGSRFAQAGYTFPKPLIPVNGKPMIQVVVENLNLKANYIFVVLKEHREKYNLDSMLNLIVPGCKIVETEGITEGAACTALLAKEFINNKNSLFFANSDQFVEWNTAEFMYNMQETDSDGGIVTFKNIHPKWSYAKVNDSGFVTEVAEKNPISDNATVGYYYWKHGSDFVKYAEEMIEEDIRVNNEFYVCPVFNQAIADGKKIRTYTAKEMWGLGTPEDLEYFIANYKG